MLGPFRVKDDEGGILHYSVQVGVGGGLGSAKFRERAVSVDVGARVCRFHPDAERDISADVLTLDVPIK